MSGVPQILHTVVGVDYLFESKHPTANLKGLHLDFRNSHLTSTHS